MAFSRRTILRYGLGGSLLLAAGGAGMYFQPSVTRRPRKELQALRPSSFSVLAAVVDRMIPPRAGFPPADALEIPEKIDAFLSICHPSVGRDFERVLRLVENGLVGFVLDGRTNTFTALSPKEQDEALGSWRTSTWKFRRTVYQALHGLCMAVYYSSPQVYASLGYPGPPTLGPIVEGEAP